MCEPHTHGVQQPRTSELANRFQAMLHRLSTKNELFDPIIIPADKNQKLQEIERVLISRSYMFLMTNVTHA